MKKVKFKKQILTKSLVKFGVDDDFKELREYIPGEDIRNIHWLSSARASKLLAIEKEHLKNQKIALILLLDKDMLFEDKLQIALKTFEILAISAIYYKQKLEVFIISDKMKKFIPKKIDDVEKIKKYILSLDLKKTTLKPFYLKQKNFLAIYIGDFFYKIKLNPKNKNVLLFIRKKIEENPKKLLFNNLISLDKKQSAFLNSNNLTHYLNTLKKNDKIYKKEKVRKIYSDKNLISILKETFE
ncbi:DUF58 domain-containing protein [Caminibacter pacificus]